MIQWEQFLPEVMIDLPGVPEPLAIHHIRNAAMQFCEETRLWSEYLDAISVQANEGEYTLDGPQHTNVVDILSASFNGSPLGGPFSESELDKKRPGWREETGAQPFLCAKKGNLIRLIPIPTEAAANALRAAVAVKPALTAHEGPDFLLADWHEAIGYGAKERLLMVPGKDWTNADLALYFGKQFRKKVNDGRAKFLKGGSRSVTMKATTLGGEAGAALSNGLGWRLT